jgi:hypothetical protein
MSALNIYVFTRQSSKCCNASYVTRYSRKVCYATLPTYSSRNSLWISESQFHRTSHKPPAITLMFLISTRSYQETSRRIPSASQQSDPPPFLARDKVFLTSSPFF